MKITPYQANAKMLQEAQRVIRQQNLKELQILNRQAELAHKTKEIKLQWVKPNSVDVYA
jgi:multidrug efflux pump subunit AcrA (membrane-fusion protein)